jgi:hypothetical protein
MAASPCGIASPLVMKDRLFCYSRPLGDGQWKVTLVRDFTKCHGGFRIHSRAVVCW